MVVSYAVCTFNSCQPFTFRGANYILPHGRSPVYDWRKALPIKIYSNSRFSILTAIDVVTKGGYVRLWA